MWRLWCKALGEKASHDDREADYVAGIRTIVLLTYLVTNIFICAGVIRHWNDNQKSGRVVEWLKAPVLKTGDVKASVGSNPTPSVY